MSMNDPGWGRNSSEDKDKQNPRAQDDQNRRPGGNQDGPPDLDELWRDFNNRLNRLFGGKRGGGGGPRPPVGGPPGAGFDGLGKGIGIAAVLGFFFWLASGFFIVQEGNEAVVLQFGKYHHTASPGFQWRLPYPIQQSINVNSSTVRTVEVGYRNDVKNKIPRESLMLTDDENIIDLQFAVQYRIKDAGEYLFNNVDSDQAVKEAAETGIREVVGQSKMDYVLYEGREQVALKAAKVIQGILDKYKAGISVSNVTVQNVQPPEQVQAAFDDAVKAGQDRERLKSEGQAYANDVIPRAKGAASRLMEEAEGYKSRVVAQAQGDAARFNSILAEYQQAPKVMRERMYLETMQQIFSNVSKVLVDSKNKSQLLYLPLDKLIQQAPGASGSTKASAGKSDKPADGSASAADGVKTGNSVDSETAYRNSLMDRDRGGR